MHYSESVEKRAGLPAAAPRRPRSKRSPAVEKVGAVAPVAQTFRGPRNLLSLEAYSSPAPGASHFERSRLLHSGLRTHAEMKIFWRLCTERLFETAVVWLAQKTRPSRRGIVPKRSVGALRLLRSRVPGEAGADELQEPCDDRNDNEVDTLVEGLVADVACEVAHVACCHSLVARLRECVAEERLGEGRRRRVRGPLLQEGEHVVLPVRHCVPGVRADGDESRAVCRRRRRAGRRGCRRRRRDGRGRRRLPAEP